MKIVSVTITFNPKIERLSLQLAELRKVTYKSLIIDNASNNIGDIEKLIENEQLELHKLNQNMGIAAALNVGIKRAIELNCDYLIFFDHDSLPTVEMINNLISDFKQLKQNKINVACIGPTIIDKRKNSMFLNVFSNEPRKVDHIISSGSLYESEIFKSVGLMDESLFIDFVDIEWCARATSKGYQCFISNRAVLDHEFGDMVKKFFNQSIHIHSPIRNYYFIRNFLRMIKKNYVENKVKWRMVKQCFKIIISIIFFSPNKVKRIKYILKAIGDQ